MGGENKEVGSRFGRNDIAERTDAVDRAGILVFRGLKALKPARQLILGVRRVVFTEDYSSCNMEPSNEP
jgi:hypothetical protein